MVKNRTAVFWIWALAWLPLGIVVVTLVRGNVVFIAPGSLPMMLMSLPAAVLSLIPVAPCGLPLALAWRQIRRLGHTEAAWATVSVLAPLTAIASLFAGLLGPIAIAVYAAVLSVPAWVVYAILRRRGGKAPQESR